MTFPQFSVVVREHPGGIVVKLRGQVDDSTSDQVDTVLRRAVTDGARVVIIDLRLAELTDRSALDPIVRAFQRLRDQGGDVVLRDPCDGTRQLLESAGLKKMLRVIES